MKINANSIKAGNILEFEDDLWVVAKNPEHTKPGKGGAFIQVELKSISKGTKLNKRFRSEETVEKAFLEAVDMQYLYKDDTVVHVMDNNNFEQRELPIALFDGKESLLQDEMMLKVEFYEDNPVNISFPDSIIVEITETEPTVKGQTAAASYKPAIIDSGARIMVPPFIDVGDKIVIKSEDLTYVERAK